MGFSRQIGLANFAYLIFTEMQNFQYPCFSDSSVGACRHLGARMRNVMGCGFYMATTTSSYAMFRVRRACARPSATQAWTIVREQESCTQAHAALP
jgi:hypothetical protein